jgi:hypothetical protein
MNVSLTPKEEEQLQEMCLKTLRQEIQQGIDQADQGEFSKRTIADLKAEARRH